MLPLGTNALTLATQHVAIGHMTIITVSAWKCDVCGHEWLKGKTEPKHCARCKSRKWNSFPSQALTEKIVASLEEEQPRKHNSSLTEDITWLNGSIKKRPALMPLAELRPCRHGLTYCLECRG